jgi:hypothetical protein
MFGWPKRIAPRASDRFGAVHTLADNYDLTPEQYATCARQIRALQQLYDEAAVYVGRRGIDPEVVFAGNEWAELAHRTGITFRTAYSDINYLRLHAPFAGYHLPILDRLDERRFPDDWGDEFIRGTIASAIPHDIVDILAKRLPARDRLLPLVPEYLDHIRHVPKRYIVRIPRMLGEMGIEVHGVLVNADVILSQSRINGMLCSGVLDKLDLDIARRGRIRVLEIGPGYGAMAYALKGIFGDRLEYVGIDLPSSLYYSLLYLGSTSSWAGCHLLRPGEKMPERFDFAFVVNYLTEEFANSIGPVDMAFNCMSFPEMSPAQVGSYGRLLRQVLRKDGVIFDENAANKPHHTDSKAILKELFPFRKPVRSNIVTTKNWSQDVWATRYIGEIFDRQDALLARELHLGPCNGVGSGHGSSIESLPALRWTGDK